MTAFIAGFSLGGAMAGAALGRGVGTLRRALLIIGFAVLQLATMWLSFLPAIAEH